jgi:hypothetical protein
MAITRPSSGRATAALLPAMLALALAGCTASGGGIFGGRTTTQAAAATEAEIDIRRYLGPDFCPEVRVRDGTEALRRYVRGYEDDPGYVVWQASVGQTARECLYDLQGNLTVRVGVSGRVLAGPKGGPGEVTLPLRIAVVQGTSNVLASDLYQVAATIPASNTMSFAEVREITVPSPGQARNYLIYVGFDDGSG